MFHPSFILPATSSQAHIPRDMTEYKVAPSVHKHSSQYSSRGTVTVRLIQRFRSCSRTRKPGREAPMAARALPAGPALPAHGRRTAAAPVARCSLWAADAGREGTAEGETLARPLWEARGSLSAQPTGSSRAGARLLTHGCPLRAPPAALPRTGSAFAARSGPQLQ